MSDPNSEEAHQEFRLQNDREWRAKIDHLKAKIERLEAELELWRKGALPAYNHDPSNDFTEISDGKLKSPPVKSINPVFYRGDEVRTFKGAAFRGVVVAAFPTLAGMKRVVVEATHPDYAGTLHVYPVEQLEHVDGEV